MHAAVLHETGKPLQIERVHLADLGPRDVLIKLGASGLCHTDLEVMRGALPLPLPIVLGHEGAGRVEAVGRDVTGVRSGDRVVCSWSPNCGQCYYCDHDQPILCERVVAAVAGAPCRTAGRASASATPRSTTSRSCPRTPSTASCPRRAPCRCRRRS